MHECKIVEFIEKAMKKEGVWKYVTSFSALEKPENFVIAANNPHSYISEEYLLTKSFKVRVVVILKSMEQVDGACDKSCENQGECRKLPYSSVKYCICKPYYEGM